MSGQCTLEQLGAGKLVGLCYLEVVANGSWRAACESGGTSLLQGGED